MFRHISRKYTYVPPYLPYVRRHVRHHQHLPVCAAVLAVHIQTLLMPVMYVRCGSLLAPITGYIYIYIYIYICMYMIYLKGK